MPAPDDDPSWTNLAAVPLDPLHRHVELSYEWLDYGAASIFRCSCGVTEVSVSYDRLRHLLDEHRPR